MAKPVKTKGDLFASMEDDLKQFWAALSGSRRRARRLTSAGAIAERGDVEMAPLTMKFLEHCEPGELVRARFGPKVEWGIVADRQQEKRVVVISGENAPWCLDEQSAVLQCLSYGKEYDLLPEYGGPFEVFDGSGGTVEPGTLLYARPDGPGKTTDRYLIARTMEIHFRAIGKGPYLTTTKETERFVTAGPLSGLNLDQFTLEGEPGGNRAGFKRWSVWMMLPPDPDRPMKVFEHGQENPQEH
jgi:hypothetical protein